MNPDKIFEARMWEEVRRKIVECDITRAAMARFPPTDPAPCPAPIGHPMRMVSETVIEEMLRSVVYERENTTSRSAFERCERVLKSIQT